MSKPSRLQKLATDLNADARDILENRKIRDDGFLSVAEHLSSASIVLSCLDVILHVDDVLKKLDHLSDDDSSPDIPPITHVGYTAAECGYEK